MQGYDRWHMDEFIREYGYDQHRMCFASQVHRPSRYGQTHSRGPDNFVDRIAYARKGARKAIAEKSRKENQRRARQARKRQWESLWGRMQSYRMTPLEQERFAAAMSDIANFATLPKEFAPQ